MRLETSVKYVRNLKDVIRDIFSAARIYHLTHDQLLDRLSTKLYDRKDYKRLPDWARCELRGFTDGCFDALFRYELTWRVRLDGNLIDGDDVPKGRWHEVQTGAFVWHDDGSVFSDSNGEK